MLGFVIPLKSRQVSRDWRHVSRLLERTLRSVCAQTHPGFHVVVACHEIPELDFRHPQIDFLPVGCDPPGLDVKARRRDKSLKLYQGLQRIRESDPTHVMVVDAADLVSRRLASHVTDHPGANGWFFRSGYICASGMPALHVERRRFHHWCGSGHILKVENIELPDAAERRWRLAHRWVVIRQRARGTPLRPLPFPGAIYNVSHGENLNDWAPILWPKNPFLHLTRRLLYHRQTTPEIRDEFGLYPVEAADPSNGP